MSSQPKRATCALVDDHEAVRTGTRGRLERVDWIDVVCDVGTAREALTAMRQLRPDVALVDVRLPDGDGATVARTLAAEGCDTKFVLYSGTATTAQAEQALESGISGFVLKDSTLETVVDALRSAYEGRRYIDPTIAADLLAPRGNLRPLSRRELEILARMADGGQNASIAHELQISTETVKAHVSNIFGKLGADSRTHAVAIGLRSGIID
jgi:DNA-binding NarL/FixJ family response regulator